jgi:diguanylate cyclase (GGDEF)-like protein
MPKQEPKPKAKAKLTTRGLMPLKKINPGPRKIAKPLLVNVKHPRKSAARTVQDRASHSLKTALLGAGGKPQRKAAHKSAHKKNTKNPDRKSDPVIAKLEARVRKLTVRLAEAKSRIEELESWADKDFLLNVLNRRGFERELDQAIDYIKRYHATGALVALDVDRLKPINDEFGHAAGDTVLKGIVDVILRHVRSSDIVGRLGGDEFAILFWNLSEGDVRAKAAALEQAIDRLTFVFRGRLINSGASTGVAVLTPGDVAVAVLERADLAMYERKRNRRNGLNK